MAIRVLVVDDEPIFRLDLCEMLKRAGYEVVDHVNNGYEAVESCRVHRPDVVLMDVKMPTFDGLSAAEIIFKEALCSCVIVLTAYTDPESIRKAQMAGVMSFLVKPIAENELIAAIEIAYTNSNRMREMHAEIDTLLAQRQERTLIDQAKELLSKLEQISEYDAYAKMRTMSMNHGKSMVEVARDIIKLKSERSSIDRAKELLMRREGIDEATAYKKLKKTSKLRECTLDQAAYYYLHKYEGP